MQGYDEAVQVSPRIRRLVAPNPSVMTGPGTNTYLVGTEGVAVIDPVLDQPYHAASAKQTAVKPNENV